MIIDLTDLDFSNWYLEDLEDLLEEYPNLFEMSIEDMKRLKTKLYWEAQGYIDTANRIESQADIIGLFIKKLEEK